MGYNATVVICLDHLYSIENDPSFGADLALAIKKNVGNGPNLTYAPHGTVVVENHHSNYIVPVLVGGNTGRSLIDGFVEINPNETEDDCNVRLLKHLARALGYRVSKVPNKK